jgi:adenine-specific DNA-methyltransferase
MPSLYFKGKSAVWNHHLSVPYHTLEKDKKASLKGKDEDENLIIEGDNLLALKALLPKYQGKIKCVYIDPPYNTGNGNGVWVYDDNVSSPLIKEWLKKEVDINDLARHEKWLCMMTPRLKLLRDLLSDDGMIFISISDGEIHNLTCLMNEIFTEDNFLASIARLTKRGGNKGEFNKPKKDYVLCYFKDKNSIQTEMFGRKLNIDDIEWDEEVFNGKKRKFIQGDIPYREKLEVRKNQRYYIKAPDGSLMIPPGNIFPKEKTDGAQVIPQSSKDKCWSWSLDRYLLEREIGRFIFKKSNKSPFLDQHNKQSKWTIYKKVFEDEKAVMKEIFIDFLDKFPNSLGTKALEDLKLNECFDNPKPPQLVDYLISIASDEDAIILDSFSGSGTTAQSVLELNKNSGNRKFILVQMVEEIKKEKPAFSLGFKFVHEITRERVKRVIEKNKLDTGFTYYKLGPSIDADSILAGKLPLYEEFAKYVFYLATGKNYPDKQTIKEKDYFVGKLNNESIYLLYKKDINTLKNLSITLEWAEQINKKDSGKKIVYAPACFLDDEYLEKFNIQFVSIPYNLFEKK